VGGDRKKELSKFIRGSSPQVSLFKVRVGRGDGTYPEPCPKERGGGVRFDNTPLITGT